MTSVGRLATSQYRGSNLAIAHDVGQEPLSASMVCTTGLGVAAVLPLPGAKGVAAWQGEIHAMDAHPFGASLLHLDIVRRPWRDCGR